MAVPTTSGLYTYSTSAISLLTAALRIAQVVGEEETPTGAQLQNGLDAFNILVKNIQASGAHVWLQEEAILFLQPNQYQYQLGAGSPDHACLFADLTETSLVSPASASATSITVGSIAGIGNGDTIGISLTAGGIFWTTVSGSPSGSTVTLAAGLPSGASDLALVFDYPTPLARPLKTKGARRYTYSSNAEIPLIPMTRLDYANLTTKEATGTIQQFFFDPQTGQGSYSNLIAIMNVYPAPADDTMALRFTAQRPIQDFANLSNLPDFPAEWLAALKWMLAAEIAPEYGVPAQIMEIIKMQGDPKLAMLTEWDKEDTGTTVYPFSQAVYQLIAGALRLCGGTGPLDVPNLGAVNNGLLTLNALVQAWQSNNMHVWTQERVEFSMVAGTATYQIATGLSTPNINAVRPLRVTGARLINTSTQASSPLIPMSRWDYDNLSDTTSPEGPPTQFFYDPQIPNGVVTLYPAPDSGTAGTSIIDMTAQRPLTTFANLSATADFPDEWLSALRFNLALELAPEYKCPPEQYQLLKAVADEKLAIVKDWDIEQRGTSTLPFGAAVYKLIARALRICNAIGPQEVPTLGLVNNGFIALNALFQQWQADDIHVWCEEEAILFPNAAQPLYSLGTASPDHATLFNNMIQTTLTGTALATATVLPLVSAAGIQSGDTIGIQLDAGVNFWATVAAPPSGNNVPISAGLPSQASAGAITFDYATPLIRPLRVYGGRRYNYLSKIDTPMQMWARLDYEQQPNKYTAGVQTAFFFDPQTAVTTFGALQQGFAQMNLWPNPGNNQFGFRFTAQRPLALLSDMTSAADFPVEWQNAITYNLALELWPEYGKEPETSPGQKASRFSTLQLVQMQAQEKLRAAKGWDREPELAVFGVAMYPGARRG